LIVGADTAGRIHSWHRPEVVLALSTLVIVNRTDHASDIAGATSVHVHMDPVNVSSTSIRQRVAAGQSLDGFTTPDVARIIAEHGLYGERT
jgi:nicotinic acid mononucleotide adenylyltransferase